MTDASKKPYEKPQLLELGSIQELTLANKIVAAPSDGFSFNGQPLQTTLVSSSAPERVAPRLSPRV
jgi:hypothetical protein